MNQTAKKTKWTGKIIVIVLALAALACYFLIPSVKTWVDGVVKMFQTGDFDDMRAFIAQYGPWAMLVSSLLMIFQTLRMRPDGCRCTGYTV